MTSGGSGGASSGSASESSGSSTSSGGSQADGTVEPMDDGPAGQGSHEVPAEQGGVGHHAVPVAVTTDPEVASKLSRGAIELFAGYYSGPTSPKHSFGQGVTKAEHDEYNSVVKENLIKFIDERGGSIDTDEAREFGDLVSEGKGYDGSVDPVIQKFNARNGAQAEAYQAGTPSRIPEPNPSNDALIQRGRAYIRQNAARFRSKLPGLFSGGANAIMPLSVVVGALADAVENAPPPVYPRGPR